MLERLVNLNLKVKVPRLLMTRPSIKRPRPHIVAAARARG
jgi:hypothetical protein